MTEQQLDAIKRLAERFNSSLEYCDVNHSPFGLPDGWVSVFVYRPQKKHLSTTAIIVAGVSPAGDVHT